MYLELAKSVFICL